MKLLPLAFGIGSAHREEFHGDKVFRINVDTNRQLDFFRELATDFDIWKEPRQLGENVYELANFIFVLIGVLNGIGSPMSR